MNANVRHVLCALIGCVLGLGTSVSVNDMTGAPVAVAPPPAGVTLALVISEAQALSKRAKKKRARKEAARKAADEKSKKKTEDSLVGTSVKALPADCGYDALASSIAGTEIFSCGGMHYQRHEENGVVSYRGNAAGLDPKEVAKARARRDKEEKKRKEEAKKKKQANRKAELPTDCFYDGNTSALRGFNVYSCGGTLYRESNEGGVTGYERVKP